MPNDDIIMAQRKVYGERFKAHGFSPQATFQNDRITQDIRFENLSMNIFPHLKEGDTIHDIGSGLCDFYDFMRRKGIDRLATYSGTEIVQEMVDEAKAIYPELSLINRDFLSSDALDEYDFIILSGTFNIPGGIDPNAWKQLCFSLIEKMFRNCRKAIAFNALTSYGTYRDPALFYIDPTEVFHFATTKLSRFVTLNAAYPLYEHTTTIYRSEYMASQHPQSELGKYFK